MSKLVARHGVSEANDINSLAFGQPDAPLLPLGWEQAHDLGQKFEKNHGIIIATARVATSTMLRAEQTAEGAGFIHTTSYKTLDEVEHGLELTELRRCLDEQIVPDAALRQAELILASPPEEEILVTHGLVIIGLCELLGVKGNWQFKPKFCEIRELPI
jgi:broad specificity phosphatase PhoE